MTTISRRRSDLQSTAADLGLEPGSTVVAADSKRLGVVRDVRGPYFKVHRRFFGGDRWFDVDDVVAVFDDQVVVEFARRAAGKHQVPAEVVNDARLDARADHLLDESQLSEQRQRMEQELGGTDERK
jgi:hypothetical protein